MLAALQQAAIVFPATGLHNQLAVERILLIGRRIAHYDIQFLSSTDEALDWHIGQHDATAQPLLEDEWNKKAGLPEVAVGPVAFGQCVPSKQQKPIASSTRRIGGHRSH